MRARHGQARKEAGTIWYICQHLCRGHTLPGIYQDPLGLTCQEGTNQGHGGVEDMVALGTTYST